MEAGNFIKDAITSNKVVLFMKGTAQFPQWFLGTSYSNLEENRS